MIPRSNDQVVMIISGKSRGSYGIMVDKIKGTTYSNKLERGFRSFKAQEKPSYLRRTNYGLDVT